MVNREVKPLASLCTVFADGDWIESKDQATEGIRLVQTGNVGEGGFKNRAEKARYVSEDTFRRLRCTEIFPGDCLISRLPDPVGRACLIPEVEERLITAVDCTIVRFDQSRLLPAFFAYYSQSNEYLSAVEIETTGTTRKRISRSRLGEIPVPLAGLPEQRRIVAILDETFEAIATAKANTEKNLQNARDLFRSHLQAICVARTNHLPKARLEKLCATGLLITYGVIKLGSHVNDGVPCLRTSNVRWLRIDTDGMKRIAPSLSAEYGRTILRGGEVLVNVRGTLGGVAAVPVDMAGWNVSREVAVVPVDAASLIPDFAAFWIGSVASQEWLTGVKKGAAYTGINIEDLRNLPIPMPNLEDQRMMINDIQAIGRAAQTMEEIYERKELALDALRKSLLHYAFTGALTATETEKLVEAAV